jgi:hypothetical protein
MQAPAKCIKLPLDVPDVQGGLLHEAFETKFRAVWQRREHGLDGRHASPPWDSMPGLGARREPVGPEVETRRQPTRWTLYFQLERQAGQLEHLADGPARAATVVVFVEHGQLGADAVQVLLHEWLVHTHPRCDAVEAERAVNDEHGDQGGTFWHDARF